MDAQAKALEKISEKIHRKPAKGGLPNVLFVQAAVENLPPELDGVVDEVRRRGSPDRIREAAGRIDGADVRAAVRLSRLRRGRFREPPRSQPRGPVGRSRRNQESC